MITDGSSVTRLIVISILALTPLTALAHAHLMSSSPTKESIVHTAPSEVILHFSEELETVMCKLEVKDLKSCEVVSQKALGTGGDDRSTLKVSLKPLKNEKADYEVSWKAVSKDSHRMAGKYKFTFDPKVN